MIKLSLFEIKLSLISFLKFEEKFIFFFNFSYKFISLLFKFN